LCNRKQERNFYKSDFEVGKRVDSGTRELDLSPYVGRWVVIIRGRVAGVGLTEEQARLAAKRNRPKDEPSEVLFVTPEEATFSNG